MPVGRRLLRALLVGIAAIGVVLPASVAHADPSLSDIQRQITKDSVALEKIVEQYNKVNEELKASQAKVAAIQAQLGPLQAQLDSTSSQIEQIAVTAYKGGALSGVSALVGAGSPAKFLDRLSALDQMSRQNNAAVATYTAANDTLLADKAKLDATAATETKQRSDLEAQRKKIEGDLKKLKELRQKAYGRAQESSSKYSGSIPSVSGSAGVAVRYAYNALGKPYVWAAAGPSSYDCSGLTMAAWKAAGKSLPHNAAMQWDVVAHISRGSLKPGDLVFYSGLSHMAIYVGSNQVINAPQPGENVKLASVDMMPPYGYGRVR